jgi:hypothetical protein
MHEQGGSVSYAAVTAKALGLKTCAVVTAGPDADLSVFNGVDLHVIRCGTPSVGGVLAHARFPPSLNCHMLAAVQSREDTDI